MRIQIRRFYSRIFISLLIITVFTVLFWSRVRIVLRDFAYLTRPVWDHRPKPWNVITHYESENSDRLTANKICDLHGWRLRNSSGNSNVNHEPSKHKFKVIDAVIFSVELDLLEIRLHELWDYVDIFIVLEADRTFTGRPKPLILQTNMSRFSWAHEKFRPSVYTGLKELPNGESPFENESNMRVHMNQLIRNAGANNGDIIIVTDVDEVPSAHTVRLLRECIGFPSDMHLQLKTYLYSFEYFFSYDDSWRAHITIYNATGFGYQHGRVSDYILADAGWHCTFCFRFLSDFIFKMTSYSHNDRVTRDDLLEKKQIQEKICRGADVFDMFPEVYSFKELIIKSGDIPRSTSMVGLPNYLVQNALKFAFLLPGGCRREDY